MLLRFAAFSDRCCAGMRQEIVRHFVATACYQTKHYASWRDASAAREKLSGKPPPRREHVLKWCDRSMKAVLRRLHEIIR
jgi:hypothetical protein